MVKWYCDYNTIPPKYIKMYLRKKVVSICAVPSWLILTVSILKLSDWGTEEFLSTYHVGHLILYAPLISFILDPAATWWPWQFTRPLWVSAFLSWKAVGTTHLQKPFYLFLTVSTFKRFSWGMGQLISQVEPHIKPTIVDRVRMTF